MAIAILCTFACDERQNIVWEGLPFEGELDTSKPNSSEASVCAPV